MVLRLLTLVLTLAASARAQSTDAGLLATLETVSSVAQALSGKSGVKVATASWHRLRGYASELERTRLDALPKLAECVDLQCLQKALKTCQPTRLDIAEPSYGCGTGAEKERRVGWYAVAKHPAGGCGVLMFAGRGERVVADRWCRAVPHENYEFFCPDEAWVKEGLKRDEAMRAAQKKAAAKRKR